VHRRQPVDRPSEEPLTLRHPVRENLGDHDHHGPGPLHALDARAKLCALLVYLVAIATTANTPQTRYAGYGILLLAAVLASRLPARAIVGRAVVLLPFSATFALITWLSGDMTRAVALMEKSLLSGMAVLVIMAVTPLPELARALEWFRVPRPLVLVIQFLYRYLFVVADQAHRMRLAAACRQGVRQGFRIRFEAAAGAVGVLFARSWERADGIYRAMAARGFRGTFPVSSIPRFRPADFVFVCGCVAAALVVRLAL